MNNVESGFPAAFPFSLLPVLPTLPALQTTFPAVSTMLTVPVQLELPVQTPTTQPRGMQRIKRSFDTFYALEHTHIDSKSRLSRSDTDVHTTRAPAARAGGDVNGDVGETGRAAPLESSDLSSLAMTQSSVPVARSLLLSSEVLSDEEEAADVSPVNAPANSPANPLVDTLFDPPAIQSVIQSVISHLSVIPYAQWTSMMQNKEFGDISNAMQLLRSLCQHDSQSPKVWKNIIRVNPGEIPHIAAGFDLNLQVALDEYYSNAIAQQSYDKQYPHASGFLYHYVRIFEGDDWLHPLVLIRADMQGKLGEVIYLKKGAHLSGNDIKSLLCTPLLNFLRIQEVIKHDDSTRTIASAKKVDILLRVLLPIVSKAGNPEEGGTWYAKDGFSPLRCSNLRYPKTKLIMTQDPQHYFAAIEWIRSIKLGIVYDDVLRGNPKSQQHLDRMSQKYFPACAAMDPVQKNQYLSNLTVAELGAAIFTAAARKQTTPPEMEDANKDLACFYRACLNIRSLTAGSSKAARIYNLALDTIQSNYLWIKSFTDPSQNISFAHFKQNTHLSFEAMVGKHDIHPAITWKEIADKLSRVAETPKPSDAAGIQADDLDDVAVKQLTVQEFMDGINKPSSLAAASNPLDTLNVLTSICTECRYEDSASKYWQLWIEVKSQDKKSKGYLELTITPKDDNGQDYCLTLSSYENKATLFQLEIGRAGVKQIAQDFSKVRVTLQPPIETVIRQIKHIYAI